MYSEWEIEEKVGKIKNERYGKKSEREKKLNKYKAANMILIFVIG